MAILATIFVIFIVQCTHSRADPKPENENSTDCIYGVKSISIYLYNSASQTKTIDIKEVCNNINPLQPVVFVTHGFISTANNTNIRNMTTELAKKGYTAFAVDWSQGACTNGNSISKIFKYPSAVTNTREIGEHIARYIRTLVKQCGVPLKNITLIGHSLGAHVSGFAAKEVQNMSLGTIPLIIGADPAAPLFFSNDCKIKLCMKDTHHLVIVHTSVLGTQKSMGHTNLYMNGGKCQPKCGIDVTCSHSNALVYLSFMIDGCGFPGVTTSSSSHLKKANCIFPNIFTPSYPTSNTTDCIFINDNILDKDSSINGDYFMFVDKNTFCTRKTFKCKQ